MWKKQRLILDQLAKQYGKFKVAVKTTSGFWNYYIYPSDVSRSELEKDGITDRQIMKDEIVIESDLQMRQMNYGVSHMIKMKLIRYNIGFEEWFSGNKSYHIHTHFPELMMIQDRDDLRLIKKCFLWWLYNFDMDAFAKHKIDTHLCGRTLIRLEHAWHPVTGQRKMILNEHEAEDNILPTSVWLKYKSEKKVVYSGGKSVFDKPCVMFFYKNKFSDCRKRIAFIIFNQFKREFGAHKAMKVLNEWNINNGNIVDVRYMTIYYGKDNKCPGCRYIQDILLELRWRHICDNCNNTIEVKKC